MGGTRALLASLGASISLVAGAALSLLVVSFVFAYDGLTGSVDEPTTHAAVLVAATPASSSAAVRKDGGRRADAVLIARPRPAARAQAPATMRPATGEGTRSEASQSRSGSAPSVGTTPADDPSASQPGGRAPSASDGVRDAGDTVSSTVGNTGAAAGAAAPLLGPPVDQAVQKVLDLLDALLKGTTGSLAGTLDKVAGAR